MGDKSKIEWTDATWNPLRGCSKISPGCLNCFAIREALRHAGPGEPYEGLVSRDPPNWTGVVRSVRDKLEEPLRWHRPRMIFVNSMSDLFHETVSIDEQAAILGVCLLAGQHTFQILTKRIELARERLAALSADRCLERVAGLGVSLGSHHRRRQVGQMMRDMGRDPNGEVWPPQNVLVGPSIENQELAERRLPPAVRIAAMGWRVMLSLEPLLGPIDFMKIGTDPPGSGFACLDGFGRFDGEGPSAFSWAIVGGESGAGARPMHPDWARSLRDQCVAAGVPFFFKQWGEWYPVDERQLMGDESVARLIDCGDFDPMTFGPLYGAQEFVRVGKKAAGRLLDGREWNELPADEIAAETDS
jgi:protein gp37